MLLHTSVTPHGENHSWKESIEKFSTGFRDIETYDLFPKSSPKANCVYTHIQYLQYVKDIFSGLTNDVFALICTYSHRYSIFVQANLKVCKKIKMGLTSHTTPTVRDIFTFAVLCSVIRPFLSLYFMLCNKEEFQIELSLKIMLCQICIGHTCRSASFPLLSACRFTEFDSSVICCV